MMPTARRKLALFTGRGADNRTTGVVVGPAPTPAATAPLTVDTGHSTLLPKLQPPLQISRQQPATHAPPEDQFHPQQQTTTTATATRSIPLPKAGRLAVTSMQTGKNAWDDSTVASLFSDNGSTKGASVRHRGGQGQHQNQTSNHRREYSSDAAYQRGHQHSSHLPRPDRNHQQHPHDENLPFVIGGDGLLKVLPPPPSDRHAHGAASVLNATVSNNLLNEGTARVDEFYQDDRSVYDSPPAKFSALRRTRLPHRDAAKRTSFSDAGGGAGYTSDAQSIRMSPERNSEAGEEIEKVRQAERIRRDREREKSREVERLQLEREAQLERQRALERELQNKRSTVFENLTPVDLEDPTSFNNTQAAIIAPNSEYAAEDPVDAQQRTPRANRQMAPGTGPTIKGINLFNKEGPLAQMATHRLGETTPAPPSLKRRHSLDYDDAELHKMSFSDLRNQAFDYDPQAVAAVAAQQHTTAGSAVGTLEERMQHYKTKGSMDQHEFFTRLSASEWDAAGDWFLEQFSDVVNRMKTARRDKRKLVEQFEEEIARREEAVRVKAEGIDKTLVDLKEEGQTMMAGKDMELDS
ncbi:Extracellular mutant protein 11 domain containing protein [Naviculisporaceae sp. PSN 640]